MSERHASGSARCRGGAPRRHPLVRAALTALTAGVLAAPGLAPAAQIMRPALDVPHFFKVPPAPRTADSRTARQPHMPFYVARKGETTIYVLGTLHVGDPNDYPVAAPFREPIMRALDAAPILAFELSPDELVDAPTEVSHYGVCARVCLPRLLPAALWRRVERRLHGNPAELAQIKKMRPWLAALMLGTFDSLHAGLQTEYGGEAQLQNVYTAGRIVGLETLTEQTAAFTGLSAAEQNEMLAQNLVQTPARNVDDIRALHRLWRIGNADALAAWQVANSEKLTRNQALANALDDRTVYRRNRRFMARMLRLAAPRRPLFVAVGALHLGGPRGLLTLLHTHGFVVESR